MHVGVVSPVSRMELDGGYIVDCDEMTSEHAEIKKINIISYS
jgi:hypothetical protein